MLYGRSGRRMDRRGVADRVPDEAGALQVVLEVGDDAGVEDLADLLDERPLHRLLRHLALAEPGERLEGRAPHGEPPLLAGPAFRAERAAVRHREVEVGPHRRLPADPALAEARIEPQRPERPRLEREERVRDRQALLQALEQLE